MRSILITKTNLANSVTCEIMDESSDPADNAQREFRLIAVMAT